MVLHGYKRPGHGYIIGNCLATNQFQPYEVSCEGTKAMFGFNRQSEVIFTEKLHTLATVDRLPYQGYSDAYEATRDVWARHAMKKEGRAYVTKYAVRGDDKFESVFRNTKYQIESTLKQIASDAKFFEGKIRDWQPVDLAVKTKADDSAVAAKKAKDCPGSGTFDHDSKWASRYSRAANCNVCHKRVGLTPTLKMRAHPKATATALPVAGHTHGLSCVDSSGNLICRS